MYLPVKFFNTAHGFFTSDCTVGSSANPNMKPKGRLAISCAELVFLSYSDGGITLNSLQLLGSKADVTNRDIRNGSFHLFLAN